MILVKTTILVSKPFAWITLQLSLSTWRLGQVGYLVGWSWQSSQVEALIFYRPFGHSSEQTFFLCRDEDRLVFPFSSVCPLELLWRPQHSYTLWPCITCQPLSSGHSCRWRRRTLLTGVHWWTRWPKLCRRRRQLKGPTCWNESRMTLRFHLPVAFNRLAEDLLYLCPPIKWVMKCPFNSLKVETVLGVSLFNHTFTGPLSVVGNTLHMILFGTPCRCIKVLNNSRWSNGSCDPSYASTMASGT